MAEVLARPTPSPAESGTSCARGWTQDWAGRPCESMKLIVQPDAGVAPVVDAIKRAKKSVDILIFRLDVDEVATALADAVERGVVVRALTAHANRGGTKSLRKLEARFLQCGVAVS